MAEKQSRRERLLHLAQRVTQGYATIPEVRAFMVFGSVADGVVDQARGRARDKGDIERRRRHRGHGQPGGPGQGPPHSPAPDRRDRLHHRRD